MKFFSSLLAVAAVALLGTTSTMGLPSPSPRAAQTTPATVISKLQTFATESSTLQTSIEQLDPLNFLFEGHIISEGINNISDEVNSFTENLSGPPFNDFSARQTISALQGFVNANSDLMSAVIEKHTLAETFLATGPIEDALSRWQVTWTDFKVPFESLVPTQVDAADAQVTNLLNAINQAKELYA